MVSPYNLSKCTTFSPELHGILASKYKNVTNMLQKDQENPLKISFCFQTGDNIVIYMSTHGHWDCTTLRHHCTTFGFTSGSTKVLQGGTISMPMGRHVDNLYCLETNHGHCPMSALYQTNSQDRLHRNLANKDPIWMKLL